MCEGQMIIDACTRTAKIMRVSPWMFDDVVYGACLRVLERGCIPYYAVIDELRVEAPRWGRKFDKRKKEATWVRDWIEIEDVESDGWLCSSSIGRIKNTKRLSVFLACSLKDQKDIAFELGVTESRVSQIVRQAKQEIRCE